MILVTGTKVTRRYAGWVADFCPLCRALRPFRMQRVGEARHVWYVSFTSGSLLFHEIECTHCGTLHETEWSRYATVSAEPLELDELERRTLPASCSRVQALLAREERVRRRQLVPEERAALIDEVVAHGAGQVDRQIRERRYPPDARVVGWTTVGLGLLFAFSKEAPEWIRQILSFLFAAGIVACFYFVVTRVGGHIRRVVEPAVARGLAPLRPTLEEIREAVARARTPGSRGARKLKPERLYDALQRVSQSR